ncbi:Protein of uncharacterised function (DUF3343) [Anaerococcus prevotii]|uniref:Putative Se/S carrier protein-like domain-containing protein n=1 Tax=Anaerococcus prevotii (strain ATCC 9321 / DSM 20548 / JCM 6508 / NCTC 11806 / PC1) TaxID=525919 RepID=C7RG04_ANAPD|nr:DUF3343 domain-containing protein [Anaerococcus prevotii]ACV28415.1 hypothetical protein Apre_0366 [Anaerococcus prevotii DSM 20548]SUU93974.1 Protein of uncharacterised function (DUF3343) [Anaerococcus prevotii]
MLGEDFVLFSFEKFEDPAAALDKLKNFDKARLIPLPPEIDAGCGYALRIREKDLTKALAILEESDYDGIFLMERDKNGRRVISSYVF